MRLKERHDDEVDINLTPLIDVVFLLLIFFMISTTFIHESRIKLNLPVADAKAQEKKRPDAVEIAIDARGRYFINGRALVSQQPERLRAAMAKAAAGNKDPVIVIDADADTTHQSVVNVLDVARELGFLHITFATRIRKPAS